MNMNNATNHDSEPKQDVETSGTFETQATTPTSVATTPSSLKSSSFDSAFPRTSEGQRINVQRYEEADLSPTLSVPLDVAKENIYQDGILDEEFANSRRARRCILYLYGRGYCQDTSRDERIRRIKACVGDKDAFERLCRIAFSEASDKVLTGKECFERYIDFCTTAHFLFTSKGSIGGFLGVGKPIYRLRHSRNCFMTAAGVWYTLKSRFDGIGGEGVVDIAWIGRHKIIETDEKLEKRVVHNRGSSALDLAMDITEKEDARLWADVDSHNYKGGADHFANFLCFLLRKFGPALVCNFNTAPPFVQTGSSKAIMAGPGFWHFTGDTKESEGEFVLLDDCTLCAEERARLEELHNEQVEQVKSEREERIDRMKEAFPLSMEPYGPPSEAGDGVKQKPPSSGLHAMVLLGAIKLKDDENENYEFVLLNWWPGSPLVVVSAEYLIACETHSFFLTEPLSQTVAIRSNRSLVSEAAFPDEGDSEPDILPLSFSEEEHVY